MPIADTSPAADRVARRLIVGALVLAAPLAFLFVGWSDIDRRAAAMFYTGGRTFLGDSIWWSEPLRHSFQVFYFGCIALALVGLWRTWRGASWLQRPRFAWLYLGLCLLVGPGLVTHGMFKMPFGRPRPMQMTEFGGDKTFKPAFVPSGQCPWGCSFVSGESSSTFIPFFAAAVLVPTCRTPLIIAGGPSRRHGRRHAHPAGPALSQRCDLRRLRHGPGGGLLPAAGAAARCSSSAGDASSERLTATNAEGASGGAIRSFSAR